MLYYIPKKQKKLRKFLNIYNQKEKNQTFIMQDLIIMKEPLTNKIG